MIKIFINENLLILTDSNHKSDNSIEYSSNSDFDKIVENLFESENKKTILTYSDSVFLWSEFQNHYKIIEASGGLVFNQNNETLWIHRLGKWDLPKGKMEKDESKEETAIREVEEECGISNLKLGKFLTTTYHMYKTKQTILKKTYWFEMFYSGNEVLKPQTEEGIEHVVWISTNNLQKPLSNTYGNIALVIDEVKNE